MRETAQNETEFDNLIDDYKSQDYRLKNKTGDKAVLKKKLNGSWGWHILWFLLLPILGNIIYMIYRRMGDAGDKAVIRLEEE